MRSILLVLASIALTGLSWGVYGPVLHWGQGDMSTIGEYARLRPFVCVGFAYFIIGVLVPSGLLKARGEAGEWTARGSTLSFLAGALGAVGALGIIMAFTFGGRPVFVMPLVFGGAPVVNSFITIYWAKKFKEIGPVFIAGLIMVLMGAVTVLSFAPRPAKADAKPPAAEAEAAAAATDEANAEANGDIEQAVEEEAGFFSRFVLQIASIALVVCCWGAYGPVLHKGQAAMKQSRLRPLICVGLAYFAIAVIVPNIVLPVVPEASVYNFSGTIWSLAAGSAGAIGALGIIMAFAFGGKPVYVMPLVFGAAPVINTLFTTFTRGLWSEVSALFLAGLMLVVAGAALVLVFAPKGAPPKKPEGESELQKEAEPPVEPAGENQTDASVDKPHSADDGN
ncbi:MAG: hypothetical protein AAGA92_10185 [Planctomycetota bacterium]